MKSLIIIPAYNEQKTILKIIKDIKEKCPGVDYLVINDCSTDGTEQVLREASANYISASVNMGIGGAVQAGYRYAKENNYDIAIQVDGDGQHDVSYVPDMIKILESGEADIVKGSRFITKEGSQSSYTRRIGIKILSALVWIACGKHIYDVTSGFRAINRRFIELYSVDYPGDYPEPEIIVLAVLYGGRIKEMPVVMNDREHGQSSINFKKSVYYMIKVSLAILVRRISLGIRREKK